jgi:predicted transcriptional regulator
MSEQRFSAVAHDAVFDRRLSATDIRVLAALGTFTNKAGWCYPKQKTIAERIGVARTTVTAAINNLVACGWVEKQARTGDAGGKISCLYRVKLDVSPDDIAKDTMSGEATSKSAGTTSKSAQTTTDVSPDDNLELDPPELPKASHPKKDEKRKATPHSMQEDWWPSDATCDYARKIGFADWEITAAATECRDYWLDRPKEKRSGWDNTLKKRLRDLRDDRLQRNRLKYVTPDAPPPKTAPVSAEERARRLQEYETYGVWDARWGPKPVQEMRAA